MRNIDESEEFKKAQELEPYENKWVALVDDKVVSSGDSPEEVKKKVERKGHMEFAYHLVPSFSKTSIFWLWNFPMNRYPVCLVGEVPLYQRLSQPTP